jgi:hypothetical protein
MQNTPYQPFHITQRTVFGLLAQTLFHTPYTPDPDVDWTDVYRESEYQAVCLQTFSNHHLIPGLPEELRQRIRQYMTNVMLRNVRIHAGHTAIHELMTKNGIAYTVLKGAASAYYYPNPTTRAMGDVDFLVDEKDIPRAAELLRENGYEVEEYTGKATQYHLLVKKGNLYMEMHYRLPGIPEGKVGELIREYLADLSEQATLLQEKTVTCRQPSAFHHGLIMLLHFQRHLVVEGIGLRHLCDWAVFVNAFSSDEFQSLFRDRLSAIGLWRFARLLSLTASLYIGLPEQSWMREGEEDESIACALMQDIAGGGNFGRKDRQRAYESKFMRQEGGSQPKRGRFAEAVRSVNRGSRERWPIMKRVPLLLPWGWIHAAVRFLLHNGQRRKRGQDIDLGQAYKRSKPRQALYESLHMYEIS